MTYVDEEAFEWRVVPLGVFPMDISSTAEALRTEIEAMLRRVVSEKSMVIAGVADAASNGGALVVESQRDMYQ